MRPDETVVVLLCREPVDFRNYALSMIMQSARGRPPQL